MSTWSASARWCQAGGPSPEVLLSVVENGGETSVDAKLADLAATENHVAAELAE